MAKQEKANEHRSAKEKQATEQTQKASSVKKKQAPSATDELKKRLQILNISLMKKIINFYELKLKSRI